MTCLKCKEWGKENYKLHKKLVDVEFGKLASLETLLKTLLKELIRIQKEAIKETKNLG